VEVKIGIQNAARELTIDVDESAEAVEKLVADAVSGIVPVAKLAYVELGHGTAGQVGFRS
jgi:hypothetical protein